MSSSETILQLFEEFDRKEFIRRVEKLNSISSREINVLKLYFYLRNEDIEAATEHYQNLKSEYYTELSTEVKLVEAILSAVYESYLYDYTHLSDLLTELQFQPKPYPINNSLLTFLKTYFIKHYTNYLLDIGDALKAKTILIEFNQEQQSNEVNSSTSEIYLNLSMSQIQLGNHRLAWEFLGQANELAQSYSESGVMVHLNYCYGVYYSDRLNPKKAYNYLSKALKLNKNRIYGLKFQFKIYRYLNFILQQLNKQDEAKEYLKLGLTESLEQGDLKWELKFLIDIANHNFARERYTNIVEELDKDLSKYKNNSFKFEIGSIYFVLGQTYSRLGKSKESDDYFTKALINLEDSQYATRTINFYLILSKLREEQGLINEAIDLLTKAKNLSSEIKNDYFLAATFFNLGRLLILEGDLQGAKVLLTSHIELFAKINPDYFMPPVCYQLSEISRLTGNYKESEIYNLKAREIISSLDNESEKARNYYQLGLIKKDQALFDDAEVYFIKSLELYKKIKNFKKLPSVYFELGLLKISQGKFEKLEQYLEDLKIITKRYPTHENTVIPLLLKSIYQSSQKRAKDKFLAQGRLETLIEMNSVPFNYKIIAMLQMAQLFIYEYQLEKDDNLLNKVRSILGELEALGSQNKSFLLVVESYILRSNMARHQNEYGEANEFLQKARLLSEEKNLQLQLDKIFQQEEDLSLEIARIESALSKAVDLPGLSRTKYYERYIKSMMDMVHRFEESD